MSAEERGLPRELLLLLASARVVTAVEDEAHIRELLEAGVDWAAFAQKATDHGVAALVGHTLARVAPDLIPDDILDAFGTILEQSRARNGMLFDELMNIVDALESNGVGAIPLKGSGLAIEAYGDLGLRSFRDLDFLVRDAELASTVATMRERGYERLPKRTPSQLDAIHRLQGQEVMFKQTVGTAAEPHTRLTPAKMALDIDYEGLWQRTRLASFSGRTMRVLSPEDGLINLTIHGGKEQWWNIKWSCDVAAFLAAHTDLEWNEAIERARRQGCLRMLLLGVALATDYLGARPPRSVTAAIESDAVVEKIVERILVGWQADEPGGPPSNIALSLDRLLLHDGFFRRARYVLRTLLLPSPHHVGLISLPSALSFAYVPIKIVHDGAALPVYRLYQRARTSARRVLDAVMHSDIALALSSTRDKTKHRANVQQKAGARARRRLSTNPNDAEALRNLAGSLSRLGRHAEAIAAYERAIKVAPHDALAWRECGTELANLARKREALTYIDRALALDPRDARAWAVRGRVLSELMRFEEAVQACSNALDLDPDSPAASRISIHSKLFACDWSQRETDKRRISEGIRAGELIITPFDHRALVNSEAESLALAKIWAKGFGATSGPRWRGELYRHNKIRLAYVSADFRDHVVSQAIIGCLEGHDRTRFETTGISLGPGDRSELRQRCTRAFDRFIDARGMSDEQVATLMQRSEIDIAVDLNGYSGDKHTEIFMTRPAPVQVNYLGYPGTIGGPFADYIIADRTLIPPEHQRYYAEKVVYLPHTYMPNDNKRQITERIPGRVEVGLPETGFVFACHNMSYKIGPETFDIWMRLLKSVEGSVLWLSFLNASAIVNLRREAKRRAVAPERLVFAPRVAMREDHLARLRLADLFLDTLPFNAHASACDALWSGVPVLTCLGNTFPGRVAASELYALDLPELVTTSETQYEDLARSLALNPRRLATIRSKLLRNRASMPLFDTERFTRNLESAFETMWKRQQGGLPPESFAVEDLARSEPVAASVS